MRSNTSIELLVYGTIIALVIATIAIFLGIPLFTKDEVTLTVTDKETYTTTDCNKNSCSTTIHHMVYTNGEPLEVGDNMWEWAWGSTNRYSHIQQGGTYQFKVFGWYVPMIGMFRTTYNQTLVAA